MAYPMHCALLEMITAKKALHTIRNDLAPILFFAELANTGDREAQRLVIKEIVRRSNSIYTELENLATAIRAGCPAAV
jgi:hypothetical protein